MFCFIRIRHVIVSSSSEFDTWCRPEFVTSPSHLHPNLIRDVGTNSLRVRVRNHDESGTDLLNRNGSVDKTYLNRSAPDSVQNVFWVVATLWLIYKILFQIWWSFDDLQIFFNLSSEESNFHILLFSLKVNKILFFLNNSIDKMLLLFIEFYVLI